MGAFSPLVLEIGREGVVAPLEGEAFVGVVFLRADVLDDVMPAVVLGLVGRAPADLAAPSALLFAELKNSKRKREEKLIEMSPWGDLNSQPLVYKTSALTTELQRLPQPTNHTSNSNHTFGGCSRLRSNRFPSDLHLTSESHR